jgi:hypothetical protein
MNQVTRVTQHTAAVYAEKQTAVQTLLAQLDRLVDRHGERQERQPADWGYVGDLAQVEERLKEVVGFLRPFELEVES